MHMRCMTVGLLALLVMHGRGTAESFLQPSPPPSVLARTGMAEPAEPVLPQPRILDEPLQPDALSRLEESYPVDDYYGPNKFGSLPSQRTWGVAGARLFYSGEKEAPNGIRYHPLFSLDLNFNIALTRKREFYLFADLRFWGQSNEDDVAQHDYDFSKRQFDLHPGGAWNYYDRFELRIYGYSFNNLNRGSNLVKSYGFNDGWAIENRYYFKGTDFDRGLWNFVSIGYFPSKEMIGLDHHTFEPSAFLSLGANVSLYDDHRVFLYASGEFITRQPLVAKFLHLDVGIAGKPIEKYPMLELRFGGEQNYDIEVNTWLPLWYLGLRFAF